MRFAILLCAVVMTAGCSRNVEVVSTPSPAASVLAGHEWTLVTLGNDPVTASGRSLTIRFDAGENRASGFSACNQFSAPYTINADSLRFGPIISTKMACLDNNRNRLEQTFLAMLAQVTSYQVADSTLTLRGTGRDLANFRNR